MVLAATMSIALHLTAGLPVSVWPTLSERVEESDWTLGERRVDGGISSVVVSVVKALEVVWHSLLESCLCVKALCVCVWGGVNRFRK